MDKIKFFFIDIDGTLTNGHYIISSDGEISKSVNTRDLYAIHNIQRVSDIRCEIVTQSLAPCIPLHVEKRNKITCHIGVNDKAAKVKEILNAHGLDWENAAFIGDADNDIDVMEKVRWVGCPADAIPEVIERSNYVADSKGGDGAVYEIMRYFARMRGIDWFQKNTN